MPVLTINPKKCVSLCAYVSVFVMAMVVLKFLVANNEHVTKVIPCICSP